ncbi:ABC transporter ATP-binding protein [Nocardioides sp. DS6]|uniref:ABC transporter ATP-binding protein n=1 Tax=Nocardioides eburneus TaxID=3231482 RepID=A0ABV3SXI6_9ACTN
MASVTFEKAQRWYPGTPTPAVKGIDLEIEDGEFMVLVGPSGCGKSTTLRMLAGLEEVTDGRILIGDRDVTNVPPKDRDIAMVFQNYALYPHMSVAENMAFSLKMAKVDKAERDRRVKDAAKLLGLTEYLDRKPKALSGGQRQRVAMGRAIVREPQVFCMDEPLSNLDAKMRVQTRTDIAKLQADLGITTVYVTHDQVEAMTMGDRVAVMNAGELQQVATPLELYRRPVNLFVAGFIGSPQMNLIQAKAADGQAKIGDYLVPVDPAAAAKMAGDITVGVRPEAWRLVGPQEGGLPVTVTVVEELGSDSFVYGSSDVEGTPSTIIVRVSAKDQVAKGETIHVTTDPADVHVFDTASGLRLSD